MLDSLHDNLLFNLGAMLERFGANKEDAVIVGLLESLFLSSLRYCQDHEDQLTDDDWVRIGEWLNECEGYFEDFDFVQQSIVLSIDPQRSGDQVYDMSGFVEKARAARASQFKQDASTEPGPEGETG